MRTPTLESETDPYLFLLSGSGANADYLAENDDIDTNNQNLNSQIEVTLSAGDYTVEATTYEQPAEGKFTLTVRGVGPLDDRAALATLYHATNGDNWTNNRNWLTDAPIGEWYGVTTDDDGRVTMLDLYFNNLKGALPPELGNLSELHTLNLEANHELEGILPPQLGNLVDLRELWLHDCNLTGQIPSELGNLTNLRVLSLQVNQLTGAIPPELGNLASLRVLTLGTNRLSGEIPPELGNLASLQELSLGRNQLTGTIPVELSRLSNLKSLGLGGNQLTGEIPPQLGDIKTLEFIFLWENNLTGEIPPELGKLTKLGGLDLHANGLTGEVPTGLGNLVNLRHTLDLSGNRLTGRLPHSLTNINDLFNFNFDDNAGLCAPANDAFQEWLQSVINVSGPPVTRRLRTRSELGL